MHLQQELAARYCLQLQVSTGMIIVMMGVQYISQVLVSLFPIIGIASEGSMTPTFQLFQYQHHAGYMHSYLECKVPTYKPGQILMNILGHSVM